MTQEPPAREPVPAEGAAGSQSGSTVEAGDWRRLHPLSPLLRGGLVTLVIGGILIANLRDRVINFFISLEFGEPGSGSGDYDGNSDIVDLIVERGLFFVALIAALVVIALIVLFSWLSWRFHTFRITAEAVEARSGVIFRQHRRAPLERIQSVNLQRPLLARALGLAQLEVQTAGQGGKVGLAYLGYRDAQAVREQILRKAATAKHAGAAGHGADVAGVEAPAVQAPSMIAATGVAELDRRLGDFADSDVIGADIGTEARHGTLVSVPPGRLIGSILLSWEVIIFAALALA
ncbi:MAG: PH domain-containing protein, partial [Actinobacteria bacterium]|nr:PH domain-containing protein [Actinomycetota bacterium]